MFNPITNRFEGKLILRIISLLMFFISVAKPQTSYYHPEIPEAGKTLEIVYNPFSGESQFSINDDVYIIITEIDQEGERLSIYQKMEKEKTVFVSNINLSAKSSFLQIYFITLSENSWDTKANLRISVFNEDGVKARNGNHYDFGEEIKNYPDNYAVYRNKWFLEKFQKPGTYKSIIKGDLDRLLQVRDTSAGLLLAHSYGYLLLEEKQKSYDIIEKMVRLYPDKAYTFDAVSLFINELFSSRMDAVLFEKIISLTESLVLKKTYSPYAWDLVRTFSTSIFSDSCISVVCRDWIKSQPDNPAPYYLLSLILSKQNINAYSYRKVLVDKFINLTLSGKLRLYGDVGGKTNLPKLSYGYYLLSEIYFAENNFVEALSAIQTAIGLNKDPNDRMFLLSGNIWFGLSNYRLAEESYFNAWSSGSANAKEKILLCYQITHNDTTGFEGYFLEKTKTDLTDNHRE